MLTLGYGGECSGCNVRDWLEKVAYRWRKACLEVMLYETLSEKKGDYDEIYLSLEVCVF